MPGEPQLSFTYNRDHLLARLAEGVAGHLADLNHALRDLEGGAFAEKAEQSKPGAFLRIEYKGVDIFRAADQRHLYKCGKAIVAEFISFLDSAIAIENITRNGIPITRPLHGEEDIKAYIRERISDEVQRVASDQRLTAPAKIEQSGLSPDSQVIAKRYSMLRNVLEHRNGIPSQDLAVTFTFIQLVTTAGGVVDRPMTLNEGEGLAVRIKTEEKVFPAGTRIVLTEDDVRRIAFTVENLGREIIVAGNPPDNVAETSGGLA